MKTDIIKKKYQELVASSSQIKKEIKERRINLKQQKQQLIQLEQALQIVNEVGLQTQQKLQVHISDITSMAMEAVFKNPYKVELEFLKRRNKTECDIWFVRDGKKIEPLSATGGGAADIASFALRIASWTMTKPKTRSVIILDEPFKHLSKEYRNDAAQMLKQVSNKINIQFIIVTHDPELAAYADKQFTVKLKKRVSYVRT